MLTLNTPILEAGFNTTCLHIAQVNHSHLTVFVDLLTSELILSPKFHVMESSHRKPGPTRLALQASLYFEEFEKVPVRMQFVYIATAHGIFYPSSEPKPLSPD